jgi:Family of unknown function (DUF5654)
MTIRRRSAKQASLKTVRAILQTMVTLATASLGLVAALAWNDAIKATFQQLLPKGEGLTIMYIYASAATLLSIIVVGGLSWLSVRIGGEAVIDREVEG